MASTGRGNLYWFARGLVFPDTRRLRSRHDRITFEHHLADVRRDRPKKHDPMTTLVPVATVVPLFFVMMVDRFNPLIHGGILLVLYALCLAVPFFLVRRFQGPWVRRAIVRTGIPLCIGCGYDLADMPADVHRCPECGTAMHDEVRALLARRAEAVQHGAGATDDA